MAFRVQGNRHAEPPSIWEGVEATPVGSDVFYRAWPAVDDWEFLNSLLVWHWCTRTPPDPDDVEDGRWAAANVSKHDLISRQPLHLEPSLLWNCCGKHGWIRAGAWTDA